MIMETDQRLICWFSKYLNILMNLAAERAPGKSWRLKFDTKRNLIVVNNGRRDFVYASRTKSLKLRYLVRLYAKELVLHNFAGLPADHLLERMVELSLQTEEHL